MNHDRRFGEVRGGEGQRFSATVTLRKTAIGVALFGLLAACGTSSSPAGSGAQSGASSGASSGTGSGAGSGARSGVGSGAAGSGAASGTPDSGPDSTVSSGSAPEASIEAGPTGDAGQPCNPDSSCAAGLVCSTVDASMLCVPAGASGQPCTAAGTCNAGLACVGITCMPAGAAGQSCFLPSGTCNPNMGLYCDSTSKNCMTSSCSGKPQKGLPYALSSDFATVYTIGPQAPNLAIITDNSVSCDATTFPVLPNTGLGPVPEAGADATADAGPPTFPVLVDSGTEAVTYTSVPPCYRFLYDPSCSNNGCWAGAVFTNSAASADAAPGAVPSAGAVGVCIAPGATMITFWARASLNGAIIKFGSSRAGQCLAGRPGAAPNDPVAQQQACGRNFPNTLGATEYFLALTNQWAQYTVSLPPGEPYNDEPNTGGGVWNGFSVVVEPQDIPGGSYIFVKNITWTNVAPSTTVSDGGSEAASDGPAE